MYMLIDVETSGCCNNDIIVQITLMLCNNKFEEIKFDDYIIKRNNFLINNSHIHGITNEISDINGVNFINLLPLLEEYLNNSSYIIAHNAAFDIRFLRKELLKYNENKLIELLDNKKILCTMKDTKELVKVNNIKGNLKNPKLSELYYYVFNENITNEHNSKYDVLNLHKIIKSLYESKRLYYDL
jgi:DNA polymerase III epsilon subunit-like protein